MSSSTLQIYASAGGVTIQGSVTRTGSGQIGQEVVVPAAAAGELTTRTDDNTGVAAMATGHGLVTSDVVDVYWADGIRYGMTCTVDGDNVTIDGGAGDVLPATATDLAVCKQVTVDVDVDGDLIQILAMGADRRTHIDLQDSGGSSLLAQELPQDACSTWASELGTTNPLAGDTVAQAKVSNGDTSYQATVKVAILYDSDS